MKAHGDFTMEDTTSIRENGSQNQSGSIGNSKPNEQSQPQVQYSMPGILHFIQHEWARFEMEKSQWEVDRVELQVSTHTHSDHSDLKRHYKRQH